MPFDGAGNYVPAAAPNFPAISGNVVAATYYNNVINDIATALTLCITRDGQGKPSAAIDWNAKNLTNVAAFGAASATITGALTAGSLVVSGASTLAAVAATSLTLTNVLSAQYGGTGFAGHLAANGRLPIGNGAGFTLANITAGAGISVTNGAGTITIAATGGGGAGTTSFPLTMNNGGAGAASGTTFDGSVARTISYNTIGAKPNTPQVQTVVSAATVTPTFANDLVTITAQATGLTLANPTGTALEGWGIVIRIKDDGTARTIAYGAQYRAVGVTLPTTTVISKTLYIAMIFNNTDTKWDVISTRQET